ncbi:hypothetical protein Cgig2_014469 [Carnegiea gigantea]|uniref:Uncharacterized protein n=1 Tax=Carnegiea gigantea TaxID=171969 RepID=A0A9Q1QER5_9CARY|nr:hypothetical protein Cgig2_014469 [Carnegiea gigantea]
MVVNRGIWSMGGRRCCGLGFEGSGERPVAVEGRWWSAGGTDLRGIVNGGDQCSLVVESTTDSSWENDIVNEIEHKQTRNKILVSFECESLKADKAAEDHIRKFIPKLAGMDAVVNVGKMTITGLDFEEAGGEGQQEDEEGEEVVEEAGRQTESTTTFVDNDDF